MIGRLSDIESRHGGRPPDERQLYLLNLIEFEGLMGGRYAACNQPLAQNKKGFQPGSEFMSEKKRKKKDGEDKNKNDQRQRAANQNDRQTQTQQDEMGRNPNYK